MKDIIIASDRLRVHVNALGAEIKSAEMDGFEYLWQGEADVYARTSPTLFPIIGRFLSDTYYVGDTPYHMPINGIVMDRNFACLARTEDSAAFALHADDKTRMAYPFDFSLTVAYFVSGNALRVAYTVENGGDVAMPFGIGCHTAYKWPLQGTAPDAYGLFFEQAETLESFNPFGWRDAFVEDANERPLSHDLFENYTRSITNIRSSWIAYGSKRHERAVRIHREGFPFMAIWSLPRADANLICLEPCTSIHAGDSGCTHLEDRAGTVKLAPGEIWERSFSIVFQ